MKNVLKNQPKNKQNKKSFALIKRKMCVCICNKSLLKDRFIYIIKLSKLIKMYKIHLFLIKLQSDESKLYFA